MDNSTWHEEESVKNVPYDQSCGINLLRGSYTLVCLIFSGTLFISCFSALLFLLIDIVVNVVHENANFGTWHFIGTCLAIPFLIQGLASAMAIATAFAADMWAGHQFWEQIGCWSTIVTEWFVFVAFLGIPVVTAAVCLLARK